MSDDLAVGGPGTTSVFTTALVEESRRLNRAEGQLNALRRELASLDRVIGNGILAAADAPRSALLAETAIDDGIRALAQAIDDCAVLARGVVSAADGYEAAERFADRLGQTLSAQLGYLVGSIAPILLAILLPGAAVLTLMILGTTIEISIGVQSYRSFT